MRADVHRHDGIALDVEDRAQVALDDHGMDRALEDRRQGIDPMRAQARIERIELEEFPGVPCRLLLACRKLAVVFQNFGCAT